MWPYAGAMIHLRAPSTSQLPALAQAPLTYPEVGATQTRLPDGYHHLQRRTRLGHGAATFQQAAAAVQG